MHLCLCNADALSLLLIGQNMILRLAIIGFGNVGKEFARMLVSKRDWLLSDRGLDIEVLMISTKTKGSLISKRAIDLEKALRYLEERGSFAGYGPECTDASPLKLIKECEADLMVELTTLNIESGQPAIDHINAALEVGMDVITANKGPVAWAYKELRNTARSMGVHFRFEGTVMDGTPVFNLVEKTLPGCEVLGIRGILNSTSNFVLDMMSKGKSMEEAIKQAQVRGFAEADPSLDIDGWDAAAKITALANVLMEADANPKEVQRKGITEIRPEDIQKASRDNKKIKQVASATVGDAGVSLKVEPVTIGPGDPFWSVDGTSSAITIKTDLMGDLTMIESSPTVTQTAYAIFSDMLLIVNATRAGTL